MPNVFSSGRWKKRERWRERAVVGDISMKESQVVVLTPDASSRCESFCPSRLIPALLLLMLLLLRRFVCLEERGRERQREPQKERDVVGERGRNSVCRLSLA